MMQIRLFFRMLLLLQGVQGKEICQQKPILPWTLAQLQQLEKDVWTRLLWSKKLSMMMRSFADTATVKDVTSLTKLTMSHSKRKSVRTTTRKSATLSSKMWPAKSKSSSASHLWWKIATLLGQLSAPLNTDLSVPQGKKTKLILILEFSTACHLWLSSEGDFTFNHLFC